MKGVILAGGLGTRLRPATLVVNKHLLNVYDKPMIYYPIETLKSLGVTEIMVVTGEEHAGMFVELLKDGKDLGVSIVYGFQHGAGGIAEALKITRNWVGNEIVAVILGDNYFDPDGISKIGTPALFVKWTNEARRFGVLIGDKIYEKPDIEEGAVVTGLYVYKGSDFFMLDSLTPSARGELEITDFNNLLLERGKLAVLPVDGFWSDMGTPDSLLKTANYVAQLSNDRLQTKSS